MTAPAANADSQAARILAHLRAGHTLTPKDALDLCGCMRLGARVHDLNRDGHGIRSRMVTTPDGKHVAQYSLPS